MKHLRRYIRQILLTEAAMTPEELPEGIMIAIKPRGRYGDDARVVYYSYADGQKTKGDVWGRVGIIHSGAFGEGACSDAWVVGMSQAADGWGPLLYDVAMEYATMNGGGIISDRDSVSPDARRVWKYYMENRGDVAGIQMDDLKNTLTPEEEDNCSQGISRAGPGQRGRDYLDTDTDQNWVDSPLSKRWTKPPIQMEKLKALGKLVEDDS